ncbi:MAG: Cof-type HAD-IIB family hydrolase [Acidimicrobiia bacterium]|nr:Cof-type HAD-IIB family hydrolase [Acidimicrobiia bacterium]
MIATDIDGTMLRRDGTLSPVVRGALHDARRAGIEVVPTTGRPFVVATDVIDALGHDRYWIFANGAVTWHHGRAETVRGDWMQPDRTIDIVERVRSVLPNASFAVEFETDAIFERGFERLVTVVDGLHLVEDVTRAVESRVQKVLVFDHTQTIYELYRKVSESIGDDGVATYSGMSFIEVAADLVTKAMAVRELAEQLGIHQTEVASFGDNHNDVSMLEWAGRGYAMGNATVDAVEAADYVIGTNEDDALATQVRALIAEHGDDTPTPSTTPE